MDTNAIVAKSPLGSQSIATRSGDLSPRARRLLIMIDGTRTVAQTIQAFAALGDVNAMLDELLVAGLVELHGGGAVRAGAVPAHAPIAHAPSPPVTDYPSQRDYAAPAARPQVVGNTVTAFPARLPAQQPGLQQVQLAAPQPAPVAHDDRLQSLKMQLRVFLLGVLGSDMALVDQKLEAVRSMDDVRRFLATCEQILGSYAGVRAVERYRKQFGEHY